MSTATKLPIIAPLQLAPGELQFYKDEGYLVLPGLLDRAQIETVKAEILDVMASAGARPERLNQAQSAKDKLIQSHQYLRGSSLDALVNSPHLRAIASQLMEGESSLYLPFTAVKSGGGGGEFHVHQDNQYTRFDGPGINIWIAISKMTPENGCLQVVPRSHQNGTIESVQSPDSDGHRTIAGQVERSFPVRMNAGDAIAFSRLTLHGSGPNSTDEARFAYAVQFHRNDVSVTHKGQQETEPYLLLGTRGPMSDPVDELSKPEPSYGDGH